MSARMIAVFSGETELLVAVQAARAMSGHRIPIVDVYTPYAVHGLDEALGLRGTRLPWVTLAGGLCGMAGAIALQVWCAVVDWPLDVGGKPAQSALAFLPITFEATILLGGLATAGAFFWRSRLSPLAEPRPVAAGVTDDAMALVLKLDGAGPEERTALHDLLLAAGAREVREEDR
ncbi:MAG TPA: DUF3341 domain-containing protein [Thermoanaerobaculia bacterium]|jgi:hypothetical protein